MSQHSNLPESKTLNPYEPPRVDAESSEQPPFKLCIAPIDFPAGRTQCSYYTFEEFARTLTADFVESGKPFGLEVVLPSPQDQSPQADATIHCRVWDVRQYHITFWQRIIQWTLPFLSFKYTPASFTITGTIESPHYANVPFHTTRRFKRDGLGEKMNMRNGIRAEAIRVIGLAAKTREHTTPIQASIFWNYVLLVPLVACPISAVIAYGIVRFAATATVPQSQDAKYLHIFWAVYLVTLAPALALVFAPKRIYADRRAGFAYRLISSSRSLTLRVFIFICGNIASFLVALIVVIVLSNMK